MDDVAHVRKAVIYHDAPAYYYMTFLVAGLLRDGNIVS
jgi:hypothetical protein